MWWKYSFQMLKGSLLRSQWWDLTEIQTHNVLVTYKDEENQMKNEGAKVVTTLYSYFRRSRAANSVAGVGCGRKSNSFNLLWVSLLPARMRNMI